MKPVPTTEQRFFADIARILQTGRNQAQRAVNSVMVQTYWRLGQRIVEEEQQGEECAEYGQALIRKLSRYLGEQFGKGFSIANLKNFRQFYLTFPDFDQLVTHCVAYSEEGHAGADKLATQCVAYSGRAHATVGQFSTQCVENLIGSPQICSGFYADTLHALPFAQVGTALRSRPRRSRRDTPYLVATDLSPSAFHQSLSAIVQWGANCLMSRWCKGLSIKSGKKSQHPPQNRGSRACPGQFATHCVAKLQNISIHLKNIFDDGELGAGAVVKDSLTVRASLNLLSALDYLQNTAMLQKNAKKESRKQ
jgi:hypothetical protein